jgi:hypothetical protein
MANPFVQHETYELPVVDPRDGEEFTVTLRTLNAGDEAVIRDETRVEIDDESDKETMRVPMGTLRLRTVELAVVSWTLPLPPSRASIATLHDGIFDQIYQGARFASSSVKADGGPPTETPTAESNLEPDAAGDS